MRRLIALMTVLSVASASRLAHGQTRPDANSSAKITWQTSLKQAGQESVRTGKPVLIQFTATWCGYCHKMLETTYHDREVIKQVNEYFIPVLLDADENERVVELLKIDSFPATVIISPDQEVLAQFSGYVQVAPFVRKIAPWRGKPMAQAESVALTGTSKAAETDPKPAVAEKPAPELAFGGLCLVSMLNQRDWVSGHAQFTTEIRGVQLRFVSAEHQAEFLKNPIRYWPLADGVCPVAFVREEKTTLGDPTTAAVFREQLVFFKSVEHRTAFAANPRAYAQKAVAAKEPTANPLR